MNTERAFTMDTDTPRLPNHNHAPSHDPRPVVDCPRCAALATPRADAIWERSERGIAKADRDMRDLARQLERENTRLRVALIQIENQCRHDANTYEVLDKRSGQFRAIADAARAALKGDDDATA